MTGIMSEVFSLKRPERGPAQHITLPKQDGTSPLHRVWNKL
jgi:hypothetical protein